MTTDSYRYYVQAVVLRGELYIELERIRRLLVHHESNPHPNRADHTKNIQTLTGMFRALLSAKETRQEVVQNVRQDNRRNTENRSASPTHDARPRVCVGDVLEEKVAGR
jgi:hypothetical protein